MDRQVATLKQGMPVINRPDGCLDKYQWPSEAIPYFYRQGQEVAVIYDPGAPYEAHIKIWFRMCRAPVFESIAGLIVALWAGLTLASGS